MIRNLLSYSQLTTSAWAPIDSRSAESWTIFSIAAVEWAKHTLNHPQCLHMTRYIYISIITALINFEKTVKTVCTIYIPVKYSQLLLKQTNSVNLCIGNKPSIICVLIGSVSVWRAPIKILTNRSFSERKVTALSWSELSSLLNLPSKRTWIQEEWGHWTFIIYFSCLNWSVKDEKVLLWHLILKWTAWV